MPYQDSYFPIFLSLENRKVLLVGGGEVAYNKLLKLLDFTKDIKVIAPKISLKIQKLLKKYSLDFEKREYQEADIKSFDLVVVAVDDISLQEQIFKEAKRYKVLVNSVDSKKFCDFLFGSIIKRGDLTILIGTNGASPAFSRYLKNYIKKLLPNDLESFLKELKSLRASLPKGTKRMKLLEQKVKNYFLSIDTFKN